MNLLNNIFIKLITCLTLLTASQSTLASTPEISEKEAYEIGMEAYIYLYPLITMDVTRKVMTNIDAGTRPGYAATNSFAHVRTFPSADFREVVRPNFDTLYSPAWLDISKEPMIVSLPNTDGRYYLMPMLDMWTDVFAAPGKRTSGTSTANFALVSPNWKGSLPEGVERIDAPTPFVWIIGRTQTNGVQDYPAVNKIQDSFRITPLSMWGKQYSPAKAPNDSSVDMKTEPLKQVNTMPAARYFSYGMELMKQHPPHVTDWSQIARLKKIGLIPGQSFDLEKAPKSVQTALLEVTENALKILQSEAMNMARITNGWQLNTDSMGVYGNNYLKRAAVALVGLGANQSVDAIYPLNISDSTGKPMDGAKKYVMHFSKEQLPPVEAFWSITMYDENGFQVANNLNRFAIGDRDKLKYNTDGSLDIYIQSQSPGAEKESNWLPSPATGRLGVTMRLYAPKPEAADGRWVPPAVKPLQ